MRPHSYVQQSIIIASNPSACCMQRLNQVARVRVIHSKRVTAGELAVKRPRNSLRQDRMIPMFGVMRGGPRFSYCGMCKSLGAIYGHKTRFLLNHDIGFLAEALLELGGVSPTTAAYHSFNCLTLPATDEEIPTALQYAAAVTVALAQFRIADHRRDAATLRRKIAWSLAAHTLNRQYERAVGHLRSWQFPLDSMAAILDSQPEREAHPLSLAHVAEPTMIATAMVFSHGVRLAGRADREHAAWALGYRFGKLIYLLDAFEDLERDRRNGDFNPLLAFRDDYPDAASARAAILSDVAYLEGEMRPAHASRLRKNVEVRLGLRPRVLQERCRRSLRDRVRESLAFARALHRREHPGFWKGAAVLASAALIAFVFPDYARQAESWRHCLGISMNLMAIGGVFAATPPKPGQFSMPSESIGEVSRGLRSTCGGCCGDCCIDVAGEALADIICGS